MQLETLLRLLDNDQLPVDETLNETRDLLEDYLDRNQVRLTRGRMLWMESAARGIECAPRHPPAAALLSDHLDSGQNVVTA